MANIYRFGNQSVAFANTITSTLSSGTNLTITNNSSSSGVPLTVFQGSLSPSAKTQLKLGVAASTNNSAILQFNYSGNTSTNNSLGLGFEASENLLQVSGTTISSVLPITNVVSTGFNLTLTNNASSSQGLFVAYQPNLANTNYTFKTFGVSATTRNSVTEKFVHTSTGSTSNYYGLGLWDQDDILVINGNQRVGINNITPSFTLDVTGTIRSTGLISANLGLTVTGATTSVTSLTASGLISANSGLTVTGATSSVASLSASGLISANLGLTVTGATTSVTSLTASGLITGNNGLTVTGANTSVTSLSASGLITGNNGLTVTGVGSLSTVPTGLGVHIGVDVSSNAGIQLNSATSYIDFSSVITANDFDARIILTSSTVLTIQATNVAVTGALSSSGLITATTGLTIPNTTDATNVTNGGTITTAGGASIAKKLFIGGATSINATLDMNSFKILNVATPTTGTDAVNKNYVDLAIQGLDAKVSVLVATTTSQTLTTDFANGSVIDGITLVTGDRVLIKNQATQTENGVYTVNVSGSPTRAIDFNNAATVAGSFLFVEKGTVNADSGWVCTSDTGSDIVGTNNLIFVQFSGAGQINAGTGLTKTGNTLSVNASQTQITAIGTITTGVWNGTTIAIANGGTGTTTSTGSGNVVLSASPTLTTPSLGAATGTSLSVTGNINSGTQTLTGSSSGVITIQPQAVAGTYNYNLPITAGTAGQVLTSQGGTGTAMTWTTLTTGTVTSVALSVPSFLSVSGSPITSSGILAVTLSGTALPVLNGGTGTTTSTGSGNVVLSNSPSLTTPSLGAATCTSLTASALISANLGLTVTGANTSVTILSSSGLITSNGGILTYNNVNGAPSVITAQNESAGSDAFILMRLVNDTANNCFWFMNSSTRTADGGVNTATIRNNAGQLRLQNASEASTILLSGSLITTTALTSSGLISANLGLTVTGGGTSVTSLTASGVITTNAGLTNTCNLDSFGTPVASVNTNTGTSAHAGMYIQSNAGACVWFINSTTRTADGGVGTATLRNDVGALRLQDNSGICTILLSGGLITTTALTSTGLITASNGLTSTAGTTTLGTTSIGLTTVNPVVVDSNAFDHSTSPVTITNSTPTTTSGPTLAGALPILHLCRQGAGGLSYGSRATFDLSRYEVAGTGNFGSRTQMDIKLTNDTYDAVNIMSMRSNGNVGIGTTNPRSALHVAGSLPVSPTGLGVHIGADGSNAGIQLNGGTPYIDFSSVTTANDKDARIILTSSTILSLICTNIAVAGALSSSGLITANLGLTVTGATTSVTSLTASDLITGTAGLSLTSSATTDVITFTNLAGSLGNGTRNNMVIGKAASTNNSVTYRYFHTADASTSNYTTIGFFGNDDILTVQATKRVGINNTAPACILDVVDSATAPGLFSASILAPNMTTTNTVGTAIGKNTTGSNCAIINYKWVGDNNSSNVWFIGHNNNLTGSITSTSGGAITVQSSTFAVETGNVGIGTTSPGVPLDVIGSAVLNNGGVEHGYLNSSGAGKFTGNENPSVSIRASSRVVAQEFNVFSDRRIKTNINDITDSLIMLRKITPRNFNYVDKISKGDRLKFGFIGQELILVDKNLVSYSRDYIPNIYQKCVVTNKVIVCQNTINFDIKGNGNIRLFDADNKEKTVTLKTKISDYSFSINETLENKEYFVFGEEITDFHIIDEAGIAALTTSAVKELDALSSEQQIKIQNQQQKIELLEKFIRTKFPGEF